MTRSQEFIRDNVRSLRNGRDFTNPDTSLMSVEKYDTAKVRMLLCFPGQASDKDLSSTFAAINDYIITHCPDVFLDVAYLPEKADFKLYDDHRMSYAIGHITHLDASHFDIVGVSVSILHEILTSPVLVHSFERCDKSIPTFWSDRKDLKVGTCPVIYAGGISVAYADSMFGTVPGHGTSYFDFSYLGNCDHTDILIDRYIEARDKGLTIQEYVESLFDLECIYQPQAYEVTFDENLLISSNVKVNPKARDFVKPCYPHKMPDDLGIGRKIIPASGVSVSQVETMISEGCSAAGACSFCAEGNYTGGWCEKSREKVIHDCWEAKKYSAGYKYTPFSFNSNYFTDYKGILGEFCKIYPECSFLNMRMEELGRDPDAMKLMRATGSNHMTAPIEGLSPRVQNNLLNKCLSEESLNTFMKEAAKLRVMDIKVGGILTGYEEYEDYQYFYDLLCKAREAASSVGAKLPIRMKATPLVHYPLTPMEYLERKTAHTSFSGDKWLPLKWYETFHNERITFIINGFKYSCFVEQMLLDVGRALTPMIWKNFVEPLVPLYSLRQCCSVKFIDELRSMVKDPDVFFGDRDIESYISPCHRIHIDLMGSYMPRARRLLRHKHAGSVFDNEPDIRCLKTYEGAKTKCYHTCILNDPILVYGDVCKSDGRLSGQVLSRMTGCSRCESNEERASRLNRPIVQTLDAKSFKALPKIPNIQRTRFVINRSRDYDLLNPDNTAHTFVARLLQHSDKLLYAYNRVSGHSHYWQTEAGFDYSFSGYQIVDVLWREDVLDEIKRVIPEVNAELKSLQILSVREEMLDDRLSGADINLYWFESSLDAERFREASLVYKGEMYKITGRLDELTEDIDKSLMKPVFLKRGSKTVGVFALPTRYNPDLWLSAYLSTAKRTNDHTVCENTTLCCLGTYRESLSVVDKTGAGNGFISMLTNKSVALNRDNLCKAMLNLKLKQ